MGYLVMEQGSSRGLKHSRLVDASMKLLLSNAGDRIGVKFSDWVYNAKSSSLHGGNALLDLHIANVKISSLTSSEVGL